MTQAERSARFKARHPERVIASAKKFRKQHPERADASCAEWRVDNPKKFAFQRHRSQAKQRNIEFLFTLKEWVDWWGDDFAKRGKAADDLCMARYGDTGPYEASNVRKLTVKENIQEAHCNA